MPSTEVPRGTGAGTRRRPAGRAGAAGSSADAAGPRHRRLQRSADRPPPSASRRPTGSPAVADRNRLEARPGRLAGLRPAPDDRRLRGRRLRLRPGLHRQRHPAAVAAAVREVVPGRDHRHGEHPGHRRRAAGGQPLRHHRRRRADDGRRRPRAPPDEPPAADARRRPGLPDARSSVRSAARPATPWPATPTPSGCCPPANWSSVFPEGFKGVGKPYSQRYKLQRFGRGGFVTGGAAHRHADHPGVDRRRRGDLSADRQHQAAGQGARASRTSR